MQNRKQKYTTRKWLILPALLIALATVCFAALFLLRRAADDYYRQRYLSFSFSTDGYDYSESTSALGNPGGGFYCMHGYLLCEDTTEESLGGLLARDIRLNESEGLVLLEINLLNYRDEALSAHALAQLAQILRAWEEADFQIILRFLYDWDGNGADTEPTELAQIKEHMTQTAPIVNDHADAICTMQGIFVGSWGEMHDSSHLDTASLCALMEHLNALIDPDIFLAVRTPAHRRTILNSADAFPDGNVLAARLGLFNDGMLGSEDDLGTYGDVDKNASSSLSDRWLRAQELEYQDNLCRYVPNGGEVVIDNPLNDLEAAIEDLSAMHVSYLNRTYQPEVLDKWRNSAVQTDDAWLGMDGFTYIERHLSARYRCVKADIGAFDYWTDETAALSLTLTNTAFAGSYRPLTFKLRIVSDAAGAVVAEQIVDPEHSEAAAQAADTNASDATAQAADPYASHATAQTADPYASHATAQTADPYASHAAAQTMRTDSLQSLCNGEQTDINLALPLRGLADGTYRVYLSCAYTRDGHALALANRLPQTENGYEIATFSLESTPTAMPSGRELIERYLSHVTRSESSQPSAK